MQRNRLAAADRAEHSRVAHVTRGYVKRTQFALEFFGVIHQRQQIGQRNELAIIQNAADKAGIAVAALLAVGHHIHTRTQLRAYRQLHGVVGRGLKRSFVEAAFHVFVYGLHHPTRTRPTANAHHR